MVASRRFKHLSFGQLVELDACTRCGQCIEKCTIYGETQEEHDSSADKIRNIQRYIKSSYGLKALLLGGKRAEKASAKHLEEVLSTIYKCTTCGICKELCSAGINTIDLWESVRAELVEMGRAPGQKHKVMDQSVRDNHNPYLGEASKRADWLTPDIKVLKDAELGYYVGCTASYRQQRLAQTTARLMNKLGIDFTLLGAEEYCCGSPLIRTGQLAQVKDLVEHNVGGMVERGVKQVLYSCSGCYRTSIIDWPKFYHNKELPFKPIHIVEVLAEKAGRGELEYVNKLDEKLTYHDPCHLGRHLGLYDAPRTLIKSFPGATFVEMERNRDMARCCGAGGGVKSGYGDLARDIAKSRIRDAKETGASILSTACPFCVSNLGDGLKVDGSNIKVLDLVEIVAQLVGLENP